MAIVGLGLIGASIAEATRKRYPGWKIVGVSSPKTIQEAIGLGLIDEGFGYDQARIVISQCDIGFLCTPIDNILGLLSDWAKFPGTLKEGAVISDVGSTKVLICELGKAAFPSSCGGVFIGSHPMAGSEKTGLGARDGLLFEKAAWILCLDGEIEINDNKIQVDRLVKCRLELENFIKGLGAGVFWFKPADHDEAVAYASHLPQILSTALGSFTRNLSHRPDNFVDRVLKIAGSGFKDMTRLAASNFSVWEPIVRTNKDRLLITLDDFQKKLASMKERLNVNNDTDGLRPFFIEANQLRNGVNTADSLTEILVDLEDKPGALLSVLTPLAEKNINVPDLKIHKVRADEDGVLILGFRKPGEAQAALKLLAESGHKARLR